MKDKLMELKEKGYTHIEIDTNGKIFASDRKSKMEFVSLDIKVNNTIKIQDLIDKES